MSIRDRDVYRTLLEKAAEFGDGDAMYKLGCLENPDINHKSWSSWHEKAIARGSAEAMQSFGEYYEKRYKAEGITKDLTEALKLYAKSGERGNIKALNRVAILLAAECDGREVAALRWAFAASEQDTHKEWESSIVTFHDANFVDFAYKKKEALEKVGEGNKDSMFELGSLYEKGCPGVQRPNLTLAIEWYKKASEHGKKEAADRLSFLYSTMSKHANDDYFVLSRFYLQRGLELLEEELGDLVSWYTDCGQTADPRIKALLPAVLPNLIRALLYCAECFSRLGNYYIYSSDLVMAKRCGDSIALAQTYIKRLKAIGKLPISLNALMEAAGVSGDEEPAGSAQDQPERVRSVEESDIPSTEPTEHGRGSGEYCTRHKEAYHVEVLSSPTESAAVPTKGEEPIMDSIGTEDTIDPEVTVLRALLVDLQTVSKTPRQPQSPIGPNEKSRQVLTHLYDDPGNVTLKELERLTRDPFFDGRIDLKWNPGPKPTLKVTISAHKYGPKKTVSAHLKHNAKRAKDKGSLDIGFIKDIRTNLLNLLGIGNPAE